MHYLFLITIVKRTSTHSCDNKPVFLPQFKLYLCNFFFAPAKEFATANVNNTRLWINYIRMRTYDSYVNKKIAFESWRFITILYICIMSEVQYDERCVMCTELSRFRVYVIVISVTLWLSNWYGKDAKVRKGKIISKACIVHKLLYCFCE